MGHERRPNADTDSYEELARKMDPLENGPMTTNFDQLLAKGIALPPPGDVPDADMRTKLWEVLKGLIELRVFLEDTDHLSDRELYTQLWNESLRAEVPAHDEIGFNDHVQLLHCEDDADLAIYLRYFADDDERRNWAADITFEMPPQEDAPHQRDVLLPNPYGHPEALGWLRANFLDPGFAGNRFAANVEAIDFVEQLYAVGATMVTVDGIMLLDQQKWAPYADTLRVKLPGDSAQRRTIFELIEKVGRADEGDTPEPPQDTGQEWVRLWWD